MNYNHFLNNSRKFKNKNQYRLENKKKNSRGFLIFSAVSFVVFAGSYSLLVTDDETNLTVLEQVKGNVSFNSNTIDVQNMSLDLPEIGYQSEVLSKSVTFIEAEQDIESDVIEKKLIKTEHLDTKLVETKNKSAPFIAKTEDSIRIDKQTDITVVNASAVTEKTNEIQPFIKKIKPATTPLEAKQQVNKNIVASILTKVEAGNTTNSQDSIIDLTTKTVIVKNGDTLSAIFQRLSLSASTLHKIINSDKLAKQLTRIRPGQKLIITLDNKGTLQSLHYALDRVDTLVINKNISNSKFSTHIESKEIDVKQEFSAGTITNSLFSSGNKAGLSSAMIMKLAQLFGWDIDFALDIRKGDSFAVLFEEKYIGDKKIGNGNILSAEFVNKGKTFKAIRYTDASGHTDYYSEKGLSMRKAFLRTPVDFSRISSRFSSGRKHPVLNRIRAHKGVDYAASRGTPIKAVGNGKVIFKGKKGGYGRVVILQHGSKYSTLYAHMNSYNKKIKRGNRVEQGQIVGYVGSSGLATGPHLHYEFRMNGVHRNPLTVPLPSALPINKKYRTDFKNTADTLISQLKSRQQAAVAFTEQ